jgi:hypothetical protein
MTGVSGIVKGTPNGWFCAATQSNDPIWISGKLEDVYVYSVILVNGA